MALIADDAKDRAEQLILLTERLTTLILAETAQIEAREPPLAGERAEEKTASPTPTGLSWRGSNRIGICWRGAVFHFGAAARPHRQIARGPRRP